MNQGHELEDFDSSLPDNASTDANISGHRYRQNDEHALARLGKKQVLKVSCQISSSPFEILSLVQRRFGFLSLFGFSCTILATWETVLA